MPDLPSTDLLSMPGLPTVTTTGLLLFELKEETLTPIFLPPRTDH